MIILGCVRKDRENSVIKRNFYIIELKLPNGDRRRFDCSNAYVVYMLKMGSQMLSNVHGSKMEYYC